MADLKSLGYTSIADKSRDEALEELRQIRLSRRAPVKTTKSSKKKEEKKKIQKNLKQVMTADMAQELLDMIGDIE